MSEDKQQKTYRGRIAPTPSGYLHEGHASTFKVAWSRARERNGDVVYRNDDLDTLRCRSEFAQAAKQDLKGKQTYTMKKAVRVFQYVIA